VLDSTFFKDEALFHLSGYINSEDSRIWSAENSHAVYKLVHICQRFVLGAQCLKNELWDQCCLNRQLLQKIIQIFYSICCPAGRE